MTWQCTGAVTIGIPLRLLGYSVKIRPIVRISTLMPHTRLTWEEITFWIRAQVTRTVRKAIDLAIREREREISALIAYAYCL